jgi:hypothetical protein
MKVPMKARIRINAVNLGYRIYPYPWRRRTAAAMAWGAGVARRLARPAAYMSVGAIVVVLLVALAVSLYRLWAVPPWYLLQNPGNNAKAIIEYRTAMAAVVSVLLQLTGGALLITGLVLAWREWRSGRETALAEEFGRAIDSLSSSTLEVRLSAFYRLERVATESARDYTAVLEILRSYVSRHLTEQRGKTPAGVCTPSDDTRAALGVLLRLRKTANDRTFLDLSRVDLSRGHLANTSLDHVDLSSADLSGADLTGVNIRGSNLRSAGLNAATLTGASLDRSDLSDADLRHANFAGASLIGTVMSGVRARAASFRGSDIASVFCDGDFRDASFFDATCDLASLRGDFRGADLRVKVGKNKMNAFRVFVDDRTKFPDECRPELPPGKPLPAYDDRGNGRPIPAAAPTQTPHTPG